MAIKRFLVVDSDDDQRLAMKALLGSMQYADVTVQNNAEQALSLIEPKKIEFIIHNWEMKPLSGAAFCQRVRSHGAWRHIPILIYTKRITGEESRLVTDLGIDNIVPLPIDRDITISKIKEMVSKEEAVSEGMRKFRQALGMAEEEQFQDALNLAKDCLSDKSISLPVQTLIGHICIQEHEYDQAEDALKQALNLSREHTPALQLQAKLYSRTKRHDQALQILMSLINFSPFNLATLMSISSVYTEQDRLVEAKKAISQVQALDPNNPEAKEQLGVIAFKEGDIKLAKEFLGSTSKGLDLARSLNNIAIALTAKNNVQEGVSAYEAAMEILTGSRHRPLVEYNLGLAFKKQGRLEAALKHFAGSYLTDPGFEKSYGAFVKCIREMRSCGKQVDQFLVSKVKRVRDDFLSKSAA